MKKLFAIWLALGLFFLRGIAQNNLLPAYEIKTDTALNLKLDNGYAAYAELDFYIPGSNALNIITLPEAYWQMIEDRDCKLTIDDVSKPPLADKFHYNTTKAKGIDYSIRTYWMRYHFKNDMTHEVKIAIPENATYADFYTPGSNGKW